MDDVIQPPSSAPLGVVQHVHVRVGRCDIAIPIEQVWQALPLPPQGLTALPRRSGGLLGVADVAGSAVQVHLIRHPANRGVAAARNTAIRAASAATQGPC